MQILKLVNLAVSFILELCALFIFGYWGYTTGQGMLAKIVLSIAGPAVFVVVWGLFMAPASSRRLREPWRFIVELVLFGLATIALYSTGLRDWAIVFAAIYAINKILLIIWKQ